MLAGCGASHAPGGGGGGPADWVLLGGDVRTMDAAATHATAIAVRGERVVLVGDDQAASALIGPKTEVVRLHGQTVIPGLVDAHCHLVGLGRALEIVSLRGVVSEIAAARMVAEAAERTPAGEWVTGRGWDQNLWSTPQFPTRQSLDALVPDRPVALRRVDGHAVWANSAAMALAGVDARTMDPPGGRIERDEAGEPTGVFVDNALDLIEGAIPAPTPEAIERRILAAAEVAVATGLTGVHEMGIDDATIAVYRRLAEEGRLPLRVYAFLDGASITPEVLRGRKPDRGGGEQRFALRGVKLYADGALGSRGAALREDYSDDPGNRGLRVLSHDELAVRIEAAIAGGWQVGVHAIGDAAVGDVLDLYAAARPDATAPLRLRVEHTQVIADADIPRMAKLGVIASMQPTHATSDMPWAEQRLGPERVRGAYAWRRLLEAGVRIANGSDFPVEEVAPLLGIYAAVTRQDAKGEPAGGWYPDQRMTLDEALRGFTGEAAFASFSEGARGTIAPGMLADLTVFDRPLAAAPLGAAPLVEPATLLATAVEMTMVGGRVVHRRDAGATPEIP